ncbi:MAG: PEP-CTERM sorting domain-containing protein [Verrucomicrobia bacterium]|nr:PEP-CTERM sorting domain-containing protein [Verrucomicrobiota bacterium]MCH8526161.1 PEP-CTERM sorting domain-containing protein [Kiritimatiellia bacterium]
MRITNTIPLLLASFLASAHAATLISDTFNTDFNNFSAQNTLSADGLAWSSADGVGDVSGRINTSGSANHTNAVYYSGTGSEITKNFTEIFTATILFQTGSSITGDIAHATAGFLRSTGSAFNEFAGGYAFWGGMRNDGGGTYLRLLNTGGQIGNNSSTFSLETENWYALQTSIALSANATASFMSVSIFDVGADGTGPLGTALASVSATDVSLANSGFSGNLWAGFGGGNNSGSNVVAFDNFSVVAIPEPGTLALVGIALGSLLLFRRRKS